MSTPAPTFSSPEEYRDLNRRMAESILTAKPAQYLDGGYVRRVVEIRGRRSGQLNDVPIAVVSLAGRRYLVSPTRNRNWVKNLLHEPNCLLKSRDNREPCTATPVQESRIVADVVATYLKVMNAPWAIAQFPFPAEAGRDQIELSAGMVAVFELRDSASDSLSG